MAAGRAVRSMGEPGSAQVDLGRPGELAQAVVVPPLLHPSLRDPLGSLLSLELRDQPAQRSQPIPRTILTRPRPLRAAEDSLSVSLTNCTVTHRDGRVTQLDQVRSRSSRLLQLFLWSNRANSADYTCRSTSAARRCGSTSCPTCSRRLPCAFQFLSSRPSSPEAHASALMTLRRSEAGD